jgi:hypothetical protein
MFGFSPMPAQVWLVVEPVDMRLGIDGLSARIQQSLRSKTLSGLSPWAKRTGYLPAPNAPVAASPRSKACWPPPNSTTSNLPPGLKIRWKSSLLGRTAESMSYCRWV